MPTLCDESVDFSPLGLVAITRASHVEPDHSGHRLADLSPVQGPVPGPFAKRSEALADERDWLLATRF